MKTIQFFFGLFFALISFTSQAQNVKLVSNTENTVITTSKVGEKTHSGAEIISDYQEGIAITKMYDKFGLVNQKGFELVTPRFEAIHAFQNGYAAAQLNGKWTFVNKQGKKITAFRYNWVGSFENGFAPVQSNGKWTFINEQGAELVKAQFDAVRSFKNGVAIVCKAGKWMQLNASGQLTALPETTAKVATQKEI